MRPFFPRFTASLAGQSPSQREQGRCAVVEISGGSQSRITTFEASQDLKEYLDSSHRSSGSATTKHPKGRLFLLEDLPRNHILALGSRLNVPPSFFAGHYDDPATSTFNHRSPFRRCSRSQFRLRYATSNRVKVDVAPHSDIYTFDTNVFRYLHVYNPKGLVYDEPRSHHNFSFWCSSPRQDGSWDAILLLDPPVRGFVRPLGNQSRVPTSIPTMDDTSMPWRFLHPEMHDFDELPDGSVGWARRLFSPNYVSIYDDTLLSFRRQAQYEGLQHPFDFIEIPRKLVISNNLAFLRRRYLNLIGIQRTKLQPLALRNNYFSSFSNGSFSCWNDEIFDFLVGARSGMQELGQEMRENMITLGLDGPNPSAAQWEIDGWKAVMDHTELMQGTLDALATSYMQYVTIEEAHVSNENARSLSRITVLTMFFIPLSTVASIFSMGGGFLPGETQSWVFWVVAIPILALLSCCYWHRSLASTLVVRSRAILPSRKLKNEDHGA